MKQRLRKSKPFLWFSIAFGALCVALAIMTFITPMGQETMTRGITGALHLKMWMAGIVSLLLGAWFIWRGARLLKEA